MLLNNFEHKKSEQDILGNIYPVGSIFISVNSTNPSELFGGEWEPYAQGRAIFGEGSRVDENNQPYGKIFLQNEEGGASKVELCNDCLPSHNHKSCKHTHESVEQKYRYWFTQFAHKSLVADKNDVLGESTFFNNDGTNVILKELVKKNTTDKIGNGENWGYRKLKVCWKHKVTFLGNNDAENDDAENDDAENDDAENDDAEYNDAEYNDAEIKSKEKVESHNNLSPYIVAYIWRRIS